MHVIKARNVQQAFPEAMYQLKHFGVRMPSRDGNVVKLPEPVTFVLEHPEERVLFWDERNANPFFHLMEALWMLAGHEDVEFLASIVSAVSRFSDDGVAFNGAYGHRWRYHFGHDQLEIIAENLANNHNCRRQVLTIWDGSHDLNLNSKDLPCNTHLYFSINHEGELEMMVCNRSNDVVWGALGTDVVHMSILQEFLAAWIGVPMGRYYHVTNNLHLYTARHEALMNLFAERAFPDMDLNEYDPYAKRLVKATPLIPRGDVALFDRDNKMFIDNMGTCLGMEDYFIKKIAGPMLSAIYAYKHNDAPERFNEARRKFPEATPFDWIVAGLQWINRQEAKWNEKMQKGIGQE
jgi:thymidylate synthase